MSAAAGTGATIILNSSQLAKYFGVPCAPVPLNSDIKLISLFSKKLLLPLPSTRSTDLKTNASEGKETARIPPQKQHIENNRSST